jgi:hypothetical protein
MISIPTFAANINDNSHCDTGRIFQKLVRFDTPPEKETASNTSVSQAAPS